MSIIIIDDRKMAEIIESSFTNFHAKGLDYICLQRSDMFTEKIYFFDNKISQASEVVNPHNHRYQFLSVVLTGAIQNKIYKDTGKPTFSSREYESFLWRTPLNGGNGFEYWGPAHLIVESSPIYAWGSSWFSQASDIHTLKIVKEGSILRLIQCEDEYSEDVPTKTYTQSTEPPSLTGLYEKPTADEVIKRLKSIGMNVKII